MVFCVEMRWQEKRRNIENLEYIIIIILGMVLTDDVVGCAKWIVARLWDTRLHRG